jgi:glycosyltransferase involved in cell wall biosynthesis
MPSKPITVAYIAGSEKIGGGNRVLMSMMTGFDSTKIRAILVAPRRGKLTEWATANAVPWTVLPADDLTGDRVATLRNAAFLAGFLVREHVNIIHAISPMAFRSAGIAARFTGTKRVCHLQFPPLPGELEWTLRFGVESVITCYSGLADEVAPRLADQACRLVAIPNTVDEVLFTPAPGNADTIEQLRSGADHLVAIVGHLSELKGYPTFLEAAARIKARLPRCKFLALGGETIAPGYQAVLQAQADALNIGDAIEFLGWRKDVADILRATDVMVLPSLEEGLPLSVLEAMACGVAVVASNVNGTPEAVLDGETGYLVEPQDPDSLAGKILALLENTPLRKQMGKLGRERVEQHFTLKQFLPRVAGVYDQLAS